MTTAGRLVCLGCGHVAEALARRLLPRGWEVVGTSRERDRRRHLAALGITAVEPDAVPAALLADRPAALLLSAAPGPEGDPFLPVVAAALARDRGSVRGIAYLSSTSVYGDAGGARVDETSPCRPGFERGKRRLAAESAWARLGAGAGVPVTVFRLAGIYGPGRSPLTRLRTGAGRRIVKPGQVFSRIHVADIAAALDAALHRARLAPVYNLADDEPAASADVVAHAARLLRVEPPPAVRFDAAGLPERLRSMYAECRRVDNRRMKADLLPELAFPTYREGLRALLQAERG